MLEINEEEDKPSQWRRQPHPRQRVPSSSVHHQWGKESSHCPDYSLVQSIWETALPYQCSEHDWLTGDFRYTSSLSSSFSLLLFIPAPRTSPLTSIWPIQPPTTRASICLPIDQTYLFRTQNPTNAFIQRVNDTMLLELRSPKYIFWKTSYLTSL